MIDKLFPGRCPTHERNLYLHVIAFKAKHGSLPNGQTFHVSHQCGIPARFEHVVAETAVVSNARKNCIRCIETNHVDKVGKRIVVITCDGHGSPNICTLPLQYTTGNYTLVKRLAMPRGTTKIGEGRHTKQSRKKQFKEFKSKKKAKYLPRSSQ